MRWIQIQHQMKNQISGSWTRCRDHTSILWSISLKIEILSIQVRLLTCQFESNVDSQSSVQPKIYRLLECTLFSKKYVVVVNSSFKSLARDIQGSECGSRKLPKCQNLGLHVMQTKPLIVGRSSMARPRAIGHKSRPQASPTGPAMWPTQYSQQCKPSGHHWIFILFHSISLSVLAFSAFF